MVIGGNISETSNPFSDLVQSTKYILENTDKSETLVLVTCYCPNRGEGNQDKRSVPYYAQGTEIFISINKKDLLFLLTENAKLLNKSLVFFSNRYIPIHISK